MLLSAAGLSFTGFFGKIAMEDFSLSALIFWRFVVAFLGCFIILGFWGKLKDLFHLGSVPLQLLRTLFLLSAQYSFLYYLQQNSLLNATVLLNTGPLFIPLIEWGILRKKVARSTWIGVIICFFGVLCILQPDRGVFSLVSMLGLFAGMSQGASQVVFGISARDARSTIGVLHLFFFCALFSLIPYLFFRETWVSERQNFDLVWIFCLGLASIGNQMARAAAYRNGTPSKLAAFLYFSVLLSGILDWAVFHKGPNLLSIIGASLVILGGTLKVYLHQKHA